MTRKLVAFLCVGIVLAWSAAAWATLCPSAAT